jgi:hypothetical protein
MRIVSFLLLAAACSSPPAHPDPDASPTADAAAGDAAHLDAAVDAPPVNACGAPGAVNGMVMGQSISPVMRAFQLTTSQGVVIVLDEVGGTCGTATTTGEHLALIFCAAPAVGAHSVATEQGFMCPGNNAFGLVEQNGSHDFAESIGGSVTISSVSSACVNGTFTIDYANAEKLTGSFNAQICP